eukprot:2315944-Pyramimonas_sp.AAC.1
MMNIAIPAHPHAPAWNACVMVSKTKLAEKGLEPPQAENRHQYVDKKKNGSTDTEAYQHVQMKEVRYARRCKTCDSQIKRLEVNAATGSDSDVCFQEGL